jgi:hypothetical protein
MTRQEVSISIADNCSVSSQMETSIKAEKGRFPHLIDSLAREMSDQNRRRTASEAAKLSNLSQSSETSDVINDDKLIFDWQLSRVIGFFVASSGPTRETCQRHPCNAQGRRWCSSTKGSRHWLDANSYSPTTSVTIQKVIDSLSPTRALGS